MDVTDEGKENDQPCVTVPSTRKRENKQTNPNDNQAQPTKKRETTTKKPSTSLSPLQPLKQPITSNTGNQSQSQPTAQSQIQFVTVPNNTSSNNKHSNTDNKYTQQKMQNFNIKNKQQQKNITNSNILTNTK